MKKVVLIYHSYRGVTSQLINSFAEGVRDGGAEPIVLGAENASINDLLNADMIVFGTGQPFGGVSGPIKAFLERCWEERESKIKLEGKRAYFFIVHKKDPNTAKEEMRKLMEFFKLVLIDGGLTIPFEALQNGKDMCRAAGIRLAKL